MLCFSVTPVLRFAFLPYCQQTILTIFWHYGKAFSILAYTFEADRTLRGLSCFCQDISLALHIFGLCLGKYYLIG